MSAALQNPHFKQARKLVREGQLLPAIEAFEKALGELPNDPTILFELAQVARQAEMLEIAIEMLRNTIKVTPGDAVVWRSLGLSQISAGRYEDAQQSFQQVIDLAGETPETLCDLATALQKSGKSKEAMQTRLKALSIKDNGFTALNGIADHLAGLGQFKDSLTYYERADKAAKANSLESLQNRYNHGLALLNAGRPIEGWALHEARLHQKLRRVKYKHNIKAYKGQNLSGKRLLIMAEQGLGDQIEFASVINDVMGQAREVHICVEFRLMTLFQRSFPDAIVHTYNHKQTGYLRELTPIWRGGKKPMLDWAVPIGSLPYFFRKDPDNQRSDTPYLFADPEQREYWRQRLNDEVGHEKPIVGICWRSGRLSGDRWRHQSSLSEWKPILQRKGFTYVNLQYDECKDEIAVAEKEIGTKIHNFDDLDQTVELDKTAAMISELDFVLSHGTVVSQLAGALGVPSIKFARSHLMLGCQPMPLQPSVQPFWYGNKYDQANEKLLEFREQFRLPRDIVRTRYNTRTVNRVEFRRPDYLEEFDL